MSKQTSNFFQYGEKEIEYLKKADKRLCKVIEQVGFIEKKLRPDLFAALVHSIIGQQISMKAQRTVYEKMRQGLGGITPESIDAQSEETLQRFGITFKKAAYMKAAARKIISGEFDTDALHSMTDKEVMEKLTALDGIGEWTAEMLMIFTLQRPDVLSFKDLAIIRGLKRLYHHRTIDRARFERYRKRFSPYGSIAGFYIWEVAEGSNRIEI
jgi:DNA-3-methyladenine glycosylase II